MNLPITPAKNNTDSKTFYGNVNNVLNLVNDELKNVTQAKSESLLSKEQTPAKEQAPALRDVESTAKSDELVVKKIADKEIKRQLDEQGYETKNKTAQELRDLYKKEIGTDEYKEPPRNNYKLKVISSN
jgi:hypothetical protein